MERHAESCATGQSFSHKWHLASLQLLERKGAAESDVQFFTALPLPEFVHFWM